MMLIKDIFDFNKAKSFIYKCISLTSTSLEKDTDHLYSYSHRFLNLYSNRILSDYVESIYDADDYTEFENSVSNMVKYELSKSANKILAVWDSQYNPIESSEQEDWQGYAYNSIVGQPTSTRTKSVQSNEKQKQIQMEMELRKQSIVDYILMLIIDQITLKIY